METLEHHIIDEKRFIISSEKNKNKRKQINEGKIKWGKTEQGNEKTRK